jgi:hypothetical protein
MPTVGVSSQNVRAMLILRGFSRNAKSDSEGRLIHNADRRSELTECCERC